MVSVSEMKALKRYRDLVVDDEASGDESWRCVWLAPLPSGPHAPNKNESRVLRSLMSRTGLTEAQLRQHKKYRRLLATASQARGTKSPEQRYGLRIRKQVLRELRLPKEHPAVKAAFLAQIEKSSRFSRYRFESAQSLWHSIENL